MGLGASDAAVADVVVGARKLATTALHGFTSFLALTIAFAPQLVQTHLALVPTVARLSMCVLCSVHRPKRTRAPLAGRPNWSSTRQRPSASQWRLVAIGTLLPHAVHPTHFPSTL